MRSREHLLVALIACIFAQTLGKTAIRNFPLLEFREISEVKFIYTHENEYVTTYRLQSVLDYLIEDVGETSFATNEFVREKAELMQQLRTLNYTYNSFFNASPSKAQNTRQKRSWDGLGNALKWAGGVMNSEDRYEMRRYLHQVFENQTKINEKLNNIMTQLNNPAELKAENGDGKLIELQDFVRLNESLAMQKLKERYVLLAAKISAIVSSYVDERLDSELIKDVTVQLFTKLPQYACESPLECLKTAEPRFVFNKGEIKLSLRLPVAEERVFKLYDTASIPAAFSEFIVFLKPEHKYYAYDEKNEDLLALKDSYKQFCSGSESSTLFCKSDAIISIANNHECLLTAVRDKIIDTEICSEDMQLNQLDDLAVIKFDKRRFWIYSELPNKVFVTCLHNEKEDVQNISGNVIVDLGYDCRGVINHLKLATYALNEDKSFANKFSANISRESFREIINTVAVSSVLKSDVILDLDTMKAEGLKEKAYASEESWQAKNQWQENEIKVLHAEHNKFIIIALVVAVAALVFVVFRRHRSIFILASPSASPKPNDEEPPPQYSDEKDGSESEVSLNIKSSYK